MKKSILLLMTIVFAGSVFAQRSIAINKDPIIYKGDTTIYLADKFKLAKNSTVYKLLKGLNDFNFGSNNLLSYKGRPVKRIAINGESYSDLDIDKVIKTLPVDMVETIEISDGYNGLLLCGFMQNDLDKLLNITVKKDAIYVVNNLLGLKQSNSKTRTLDDLLKQMEGIDVDAAGNLTYKGKPVIKMQLHDGDSDSDTSKSTKHTLTIPKITKIVLNCRDVIAEEIAQLPIIKDMASTPDIDDYGDQVPHFIIKPLPGTWISKATSY
jgi:hypothetical protein